MVILKRNFGSRGILVEGVQDDPDEHVTIDLTVGTEYQIAGRAEWHQFSGAITLSPNDCILVKTRERVVLPASIFGVLCSKGSLSARGLMISNTKVDPIFGDHLNIPLFNAGKRPIEVSSGMKFCSVYFQELEQPVPTLVHRHAIFQQITKRNAFLDFFRVNSGSFFAACIGGVFTLIATGVTLHYTLTTPKNGTRAVSPTPTPTPTQKLPLVPTP